VLVDVLAEVVAPFELAALILANPLAFPAEYQQPGSARIDVVAKTRAVILLRSISRYPFKRLNSFIGESLSSLESPLESHLR
jgi:hypothetical protein